EPPSALALRGSPPSQAFPGAPRLRRCASSWGARGRRVGMSVGTGGFEPPSALALRGSPPSQAFPGAPRLRRCASSWGARGRRVRILVGTGGFEPPSTLALSGSPPRKLFLARFGFADAALQFGLLAVGEWECWSGRADLNRRPLAPQASALPDCATSRRL